jgi:hypothetical protein
LLTWATFSAAVFAFKASRRESTSLLYRSAVEPDALG